MDNEIKEYIKEQIGKIEEKLEEFTKKITGKEKEEIKTELSGWDRFKAKFQRFLGWIGVIISIILFCVIWFIGWLIEVSKRVAVPTVSREYLGILGVLAVILFIYYANKWYYYEPKDRSPSEKEKTAALKLRGILMMLFGGTLVFWFILYVFFVYFVGWTNSELISCWQLWLVGPVISWILLLTLPGTGRIITKTIICVCIVAILISIVGLYLDMRPVPKGIRLIREAKYKGYQATVNPVLEKIEQIEQKLIQSESLEEKKELLKELKKRYRDYLYIRAVFGIKDKGFYKPEFLGFFSIEDFFKVYNQFRWKSRNETFYAFMPLPEKPGIEAKIPFQLKVEGVICGCNGDGGISVLTFEVLSDRTAEGRVELELYDGEEIRNQIRFRMQMQENKISGYIYLIRRPERKLNFELLPINS
ncbi:MAG: hypothetical protein ACTSWK_00805 [Promethearchaeota archaeon]